MRHNIINVSDKFNEKTVQVSCYSECTKQIYKTVKELDNINGLNLYCSGMQIDEEYYSKIIVSVDNIPYFVVLEINTLIGQYDSSFILQKIKQQFQCS